MQKLFT